MKIETKPIRRGGIKSAGYDPANRILEIEFDSGRTLHYSGVGAEIARRFLSSAAPASYWRDNIEEEFPSKPAGPKVAGRDSGGSADVFGPEPQD
jgi:hypothetical protein